MLCQALSSQKCQENVQKILKSSMLRILRTEYNLLPVSSEEVTPPTLPAAMSEVSNLYTSCRRSKAFTDPCKSSYVGRYFFSVSTFPTSSVKERSMRKELKPSYGKCPKISNTFSALLLPKFCFLCSSFLKYKYLMEWQAV